MDFSRQAIKDAAPWAVKAHRFGRWTTNQIRFPIVSSALELQARGRIMNGPFKGLRAPSTGIGPDYYTQLVGVYESTLIPTIETIIARQPRILVNVGAHWGYYALGLAMRCDQSHVVAYEMDRSRADVLRKYRRLNELEKRVRLRGVCTPESLERDIAESEGSQRVPLSLWTSREPRTPCWIRRVRLGCGARRSLSSFTNILFLA